MGKIRQFSLPYNSTNPEKFLATFEKYKNNIDDFFFCPPKMIHSHALSRKNVIWGNKEYKEKLDYMEQSCFEFMKLSKGFAKRIITVNSGYYPFDNSQLTRFIIERLIPLVEKYDVDGFILTDFNMAKKLHQLYPHLELHTSCNGFQWTTRMMEIWKEQAGISVFNPPREILRSPAKLKEMHDAGYKLKCLANETCLYGCPQTINHCMSLAHEIDLKVDCMRGNKLNIFRGNYVVPRWLDKLDEYVDIYKLATRLTPTDELYAIMKAYIENDNDISLKQLAMGAMREQMDFPVSYVPDKVLTCECKECHKGCTVCWEAMEKVKKYHKLNQ